MKIKDIEKHMNYQSSVNDLWETVSQIIHFSGWAKKSFSGIIASSIKDWTFTKMTLKDWRMLMVNGKNVDCIEVFSEKQ